MNKVVKTIKNKLMIAAMVAVMVFGTAMVPVHAASVETNVYGGGSTYNYYIRKAGGTEILGIMRISKSASKITNVFTAEMGCSKAQVWVRENSKASYATKSRSNMVKGNTVTAVKGGREFTEAYGKAKVTY
ncbi:hypothetical protein [Clostridium sp. L2-50]|jgi:hypothetical protein|uniref:hypothetical protein n=1 Tax=Clostridium sp. L2-50 TaxID=411489 RepID=UPI00015BE58E|nr:hypothetical protein [Clostridium sp. L2-50]EDO57178.1 hypothetical protein CLOL250_01988 [Clostridium sp. L2-50]UEA74323.1 hypothetical protein LK416_11785 [Lachnospiraceae bacterium GAM79]UEA77519.1 hypothetical protein LK424_01855 [Lachnospiraceae bacterium GAM79]